MLDLGSEDFKFEFQCDKYFKNNLCSHLRSNFKRHHLNVWCMLLLSLLINDLISLFSLFTQMMKMNYCTNVRS